MDGSAIRRFTSEELNNFNGSAEATQGIDFEDSIDSTLWMPLSAYFSSRALRTARGLLTIFAKDVAFLHAVGAFLPGERWLVVGNVTNEVEGVVGTPHLFGQLVEKEALNGQFIDQGLLLIGSIPAGEEVAQRGIGFIDHLAGVVRKGLGDKATIGVEVLDALGGDADFDVVGRSSVSAWSHLRRRDQRAGVGRR